MKNFKFNSDSTYRVIVTAYFGLYFVEICKTGFVLFNTISFEGDEVSLTPCGKERNWQLYNSFGKLEGIKARAIKANNYVEAIAVAREKVEAHLIARKENEVARKLAKQKRDEERKVSRAEKYNALINSCDVIPVNIANLSIILYYFSDFSSWNHPTLPNLECGYSIDWYDCDGRNGIAIKLDKPVKTLDGLKSRFCVAPRGHLANYYHL